MSDYKRSSSRKRTTRRRRRTTRKRTTRKRTTRKRTSRKRRTTRRRRTTSRRRTSRRRTSRRRRTTRRRTTKKRTTTSREYIDQSGGLPHELQEGSYIWIKLAPRAGLRGAGGGAAAEAQRGGASAGDAEVALSQSIVDQHADLQAGQQADVDLSEAGPLEPEPEQGQEPEPEQGQEPEPEQGQEPEPEIEDPELLPEDLSTPRSSPAAAAAEAGEAEAGEGEGEEIDKTCLFCAQEPADKNEVVCPYENCGTRYCKFGRSKTDAEANAHPGRPAGGDPHGVDGGCITGGLREYTLKNPRRVWDFDIAEVTENTRGRRCPACTRDWDDWLKELYPDLKIPETEAELRILAENRAAGNDVCLICSN